MNDFLSSNFGAFEFDLHDDGSIEDTYLIKGHLKTGGSQTILEVPSSNFDTLSQAGEVAEYVTGILNADLENYAKYKSLDGEW